MEYIFVCISNTNHGVQCSCRPLKDLSWVGPQIMSAINKHNVWTPTDFAIARGDSVSSIPKIQIAKDVLQKSGITLPDIFKTILIWSE